MWVCTQRQAHAKRNGTQILLIAPDACHEQHVHGLQEVHSDSHSSFFALQAFISAMYLLRLMPVTRSMSAACRQ
jgi:hypothetical protein